MAENLGCASQTVRNAIRAFDQRGLEALTPGSSRPKRVHAAFDEKSAASSPEWATGLEEECWWRCVALPTLSPTLSAWSEDGKPLRLIQRALAKDDPEPKALSCYGLYLPQMDGTWVRFVDGAGPSVP
jgi:hypothetical protein